ncbi:MAG: hypothetical protein II167_02090 [Clostridiales bacterium]|nr:hypothetical protein [Clostridiales bacterium]
MGNLSNRERFLMIAIVLIIAIFALQMFVLNPLKDKQSELIDEKNELEDQQAYLDQMIEKNEQNRQQLDILNGQIKDIETSFIAQLNSEALEQYIMKIFEDNNCPYLVAAGVSDVNQPSVILPDGTVSPNILKVKRVSVTYSTTDGFLVPQFNLTDPNSVEQFREWWGRVQEGIESSVSSQENAGRGNANTESTSLYTPIFGEPDNAQLIGYDGFIASLTQIEKLDPQAIKINSINVEDKVGYLTMTAEIDFYSAQLVNRVSDPDLDKPYITFNGNTPTHNVGLIGLPLYPVTNENSGWYGILPVTEDVQASERPFATYYSSSILKWLLDTYDLGTVLGLQYSDSGNINEDGDVPAGNEEPADVPED